METPSSKDNHYGVTQARFWVWVVCIYFATSIPYLRVPISFMGTWAHEWGHGLGAQMSGGVFKEFIVTRRFGGLATTGSYNDFQRIIKLITGLMAPSIMGGILLIILRKLRDGKLVLILLALGLGLTGTVWAGDMFTRTTLLGLCFIFAIFAWKASPRISYYGALIVSIAICLDAVAKVDYFFAGGGVVNGRPFVSDVSRLTEILGGFRIIWGLLLTFLSFAILYISLRISVVHKPKS